MKFHQFQLGAASSAGFVTQIFDLSSSSAAQTPNIWFFNQIVLIFYQFLKSKNDFILLFDVFRKWLDYFDEISAV